MMVICSTLLMGRGGARLGAPIMVAVNAMLLFKVTTMRPSNIAPINSALVFGFMASTWISVSSCVAVYTQPVSAIWAHRSADDDDDGDYTTRTLVPTIMLFVGWSVLCAYAVMHFYRRSTASGAIRIQRADAEILHTVVKELSASISSQQTNVGYLGGDPSSASRQQQHIDDALFAGNFGVA